MTARSPAKKAPAKKASKKASVPVALAERAARTATRAARGAAAEARVLLDEIREKRRQIEDAFYDIGAALAKLAAPRLYTALGHASFAALAQKELGFSAVTAEKLIAITKNLTRRRALSLGQTKSLALIRLAAATPEADTAEELARGKITVRGHRRPIAPGKMSARQIEQAARVERRAHAKKPTGAGAPSDGLAEAEAWAARANARLEKVDAHARVEVKRMRRRAETTAIELVIRCGFDHREALARALGGR